MTMKAKRIANRAQAWALSKGAFWAFKQARPVPMRTPTRAAKEESGYS